MEQRSDRQRSFRLAGPFSATGGFARNYTRWIELVKRLPVYGKRVHDARFVAVLQTYRIDRLITFNIPDFAVFSFLSVIEPASLI
jgi:predicted nucleic acid-binding protein